MTRTLLAARTLLHGVSQIFLARNVLTGVLLLVAIGWSSLPMAGFVALGAVITTLAGRGFADASPDAVRDGLLGYNGALIGAASFVSWPDVWPALGSTVVGSLAGAALTHLLGRLVASRPLARWELPVLTAPFCLASGLLATIGAHYIDPTPLTTNPSGGALRDSVEILLNSVAQVVLVDDPVSGAIILLALFVAGWRIGLAGLGGALGALAFVTVTGQDVVSMRHGLLGFSGVLVAIALGVVFIRGSATKRILVAAVGVLLAEGIAVLAQGSPVPAYTWPFILATWAMIVLVRELELRGAIARPA